MVDSSHKIILGALDKCFRFARDRDIDVINVQKEMKDLSISFIVIISLNELLPTAEK